MRKQELKEWILSLMEDDKLYRFYKSREWISLKEQILKESHYECARCKAKGRISPATVVHHEQWVKKHPELALSRFYTYKGKQYRNLIPLCHTCHDEVHERLFGKTKTKTFNEERW